VNQQCARIFGEERETQRRNKKHSVMARSKRKLPHVLGPHLGANLKETMLITEHPLCSSTEGASKHSGGSNWDILLSVVK
jgi:hypothetical protein